ncbi:MAG: DNA-binding protein [Deltaproteobacteria bacterium]|nr:DNA-binding protein [Deltaproteobacteria bacterium]
MMESEKVRRRPSRTRALNVKRLTKDELRIAALLYPESGYWRPSRRGDCANVPRPCPYVSCKHHLYLDVEPITGSIRFNASGREPWEIEASCSLDEAEEGGLTLEQVGQRLGLTRERARQLEARALEKMRKMRNQLREE